MTGGSADRGGESILGDKFFYLALLVSAVFLSLLLWFDFGSDQAGFYYAAWVWKKYHLVPYVGAYSFDFPGIIIIQRIAMELFGESALGFRIFDFLVQLSNVAMIYYITRKLSRSGWAAVLAGVIYSIFYYGQGWGAGDRDSFAFWMLMLATTAGLAMKDGSFFRVILTGFLAGSALMLKPPFGICWAVFGLWFLAEGIRRRPLRIWLELLAFAFCCFLPLLIFVFIYWRLGYLKIFYTQTVWMLLTVYSKIDRITQLGWTARLYRSVTIIFHLLGYYPVISSAAVLGFLAVMIREKSAQERKVFWIVLGLFITCIACVLIQGKSYIYQHVPVLGFMSILAGYGVAWIGEKLKLQGKSWLEKVAPLIFFGTILSALFFSTNTDWIKFSMKYAFRDLNRAYQGSTAYSSGVNNMWNQRKAAEYLKPLLKPEDQVEVFGCYPFLSCLLGRKVPANSFSCVYNLLYRHSDGVFRPQQLKWLAEYSGEVIKARPRFFITASECPECKNEFQNIPGKTLQENMQMAFPGLYDFFNHNYKLLNRVGELEIYEWEPGNAK